MELGIANNPWFALQVWTGREKSVATHLTGRRCEWFLPTYKSRRRWSDRFKEFELPLFPGYLFCRLDVRRRLPVLTTPGVLSIVGAGGIPQPVHESEIAAIQRLCQSELPTQPWTFLERGDHVRIENGPLHGLEGILLDFKGRRRLLLSVTLLRRSVAVEVDEVSVSPIRPQLVSRAAVSEPLPIRQRSA